MTDLEKHFEPFRLNTIGHGSHFVTPFGRQPLVYADWIASGRLYRPIEEQMVDVFGPFVGNTHSEASVTGRGMTRAYHEARTIIKRHVNASHDDVIVAAGSGMTRVVNKLQRILGLRVPERLRDQVKLTTEDRPVVFLTHMEHHSNHTSWLETIADVEVIPPGREGLVDPQNLTVLLRKYEDRRVKIGAFTACSNVTGIGTPYHRLAEIMHEQGGICFVDFAASAPYANIDMHPDNAAQKLDAIYFSPHKFLGGPGSAGVLVFDGRLYHNSVPDVPGGGTVDWTNPWGEHRFVKDIEAREDGGTPAFLQTIRAALAVRLKEQMDVKAMEAREHELLQRAFALLRDVPGLVILADHTEDRIGVISFYIEGIHYNLIVQLLNDRFGVQVRGGCSCAGTYGHYLLHVDWDRSHSITDRIDAGDLSAKPGWVRLSLHPTMTDEEMEYAIDGIRQIAENIDEWSRDYGYDNHTNEFCHVASGNGMAEDPLAGGFDLPAAHQAVS
ncbi:MAG: aminotransferase class V-fold PLP-dependent enzyme [Rhodothermales bacterium]|nr:aminotransferase class V-fold PLP-dependent enzyme [Rhodothermales bacterium]